MTDLRATAAVPRQGVIGMFQKAVGGAGPKFSMQQVAVTSTGRIATGLATIWTGSCQVTVVTRSFNGQGGSGSGLAADYAVLVAFSGGSADVGVIAHTLSSGPLAESAAVAVNLMAAGV